jgi:hypothetical protein
MPPWYPQEPAVTSAEHLPRDSRFSPSYPQRVHLKERSQLIALLNEWKERVAAASQQLAAMPEGPARAARQKLYFQMGGACDQIAEAVRRLPMEVGHLYEEDKLRLDEAVAALERLFRQWEAEKR